MANCGHTYASMGIANEQLFTLCALDADAAKFCDSFNSQGLTNTMAWAYADVDAPTLFNDYFISVCVNRWSKLRLNISVSFTSGICGVPTSFLRRVCQVIFRIDVSKYSSLWNHKFRDFKLT